MWLLLGPLLGSLSFHALATEPVGRIDGRFEVSATGAATYTIPLELPPGRLGMKPDLSLTYNSHAGDGFLGWGWSLSGLSEIQRCGSTWAEDGKLRAVRFDDADNYCLDGQRLIAVRGAYGADQTEYRTERDTFRKIIGIGTPHRRFLVYSGDRTIATYGELEGCDERRATAAPPCGGLIYARGGVIRSWLVVRLADRFGNYIETDYTRRTNTHLSDINGDGEAEDTRSPETVEYYPIRIRYTGNLKTKRPALREVELTYETRPDIFRGYYSGIRIERTRRLVRIKTSVSSAGDVLEYRLAYDRSPATGRSRLVSATMCAADGACRPGTQFEYEDASNGFSKVFQTELSSPALSIANRRLKLGGLVAADITGEGRTDLVFTRGGTLRFIRANAGLPQSILTTETDTHIPIPAEVSFMPIDFNRDGRTDLLMVDLPKTRPNEPIVSSWLVLQSTGAGFELKDTGIARRHFDRPFTELIQQVHLADLNGDGVQGLITCEKPVNADVPEVWAYRLHNGRNNFGGRVEMPLFPTSSSCRADKILFVDVNGDGSMEMATAATGGNYMAAVLNGTQVEFFDTKIPAFVSYFAEGRILDLNGDGLDDVVWQSCGVDRAVSVWDNTGNGFVGGMVGDGTGAFGGIPALEGDQGQFNEALKVSQVLDYNLDGRQDILLSGAYCPPNTSEIAIEPKWSILRSTGERIAFDETGFPLERSLLDIDYPYTVGIGIDYQRPRIVDLNGDYVPDLVLVRGDKFEYYLGTGKIADFLLRVRDGMTGIGPAHADWAQTFSVEFRYAVATDPTVYRNELFGIAPPSCDYPLSCLRPQLTLVASHREDRGREHLPAEFTYEYRNARADLLGRGFLGFGQRFVRYPDGARYIQARYDNFTRQDTAGGRHRYPFAGLVRTSLTEIELRPQTWWRSMDTYDYQVHELNGGKTWFAFVHVRRNKEEEGAAGPATPNDDIRSTLARIEVDDFGNETLIARDLGDGTGETISTSFQNDAATWLIGLPREQRSTSVVAGVGQTKTMTWEYDSETGVVRKETREPNGGADIRLIRSYEYDLLGNANFIREDGGTAGLQTTTVAHDEGEAIFPRKIWNALHHLSETEYEAAFGRMTQLKDPNGVRKQWQYDGFGRLVRSQRDGSAPVTYTYSRTLLGGHEHLRIGVIGPGFAPQAQIFDRLGRVITEATRQPGGQWSVSRIRYDRFGRRAAITVPARMSVNNPAENTFAYDHLGRITLIRRADESTMRYDYAGRDVVSVDWKGGQRKRTINGLGQIVSVTDAIGGTTTYQFGPFGLLWKVRDALGNTTTITKDPYDRTTELLEPNAGAQSFRYDAFERVVWFQDAESRVSEITYDLLDRPLTKTDSDGKTVWTYDTAVNGLGKPATAMGPWGHAERYAYDSAGRLSSVTSAVAESNYRADYDYSPEGLLSKTTFQADHEPPFHLHYRYQFGILSEVLQGEPAKPFWELTAVDAWGNLTEEHFANGIRRTYQTDPETGRFKGIKSFRGEVLRQDLEVRFSPNGNLHYRADAIRNAEESFGYDGENRLMGSKSCLRGDCITTAYTYDLLGNLRSKPGVGTFEYNSPLPHAVTKAGADTFVYDRNGNMIQRPGSAFRYTAFNKLRSVSGAFQAQFEYSPHQQLTRRKTDSEESIHIGRDFSRHRSQAETVDRMWIHAGERLLGLLVRSRNGSTQESILFALPDHLGSAFELTDAAGGRVASIRFDPFGGPRQDWSTTTVQLPEAFSESGFSGFRHEPKLGLVDMGGRVYDPRLGRFLSPDPLVPYPLVSQSLNRYSYVLNNPLSLRDPSGLHSDCPDCHTVWEEKDFDPLYIEGDKGDKEVMVTPSSSPPPAPWGSVSEFLSGLERDYGISNLQKPPPFVGTAAGVVVDVVPVAGAIKGYNEALDAAAQTAADEEVLKTAIYLGLAAVEGGSAIVEGLSLGTATLATAPAKKALKQAAKELITELPELILRFCTSFLGDTPVWTPAGQVPISSVRPGDFVWSWNEFTDRAGWSPVTATSGALSSEMVRLVVDGNMIVATRDHPFFTVDRGWVEAGQLRKGERLRVRDGGTGLILRVDQVPGTHRVYNLTVASGSTYYAGAGGWLVHNAKPCVVSFQPKGGYTRDVLTKGFHLNVTRKGKAAGEITLKPIRTPTGDFIIKVEGAAHDVKIDEKVVEEVRELLTSNADEAMDRANGIISSFGHEKHPGWQKRVEEMNNLKSAIGKMTAEKGRTVVQ